MDLSYSALVDKIQGNISVGKDFIISISSDYIDIKSKIAEAERNLHLLNNEKRELKSGVNHIMKHLNLERPLAIVVNDGIIVVSDADITLESNVLK